MQALRRRLSLLALLLPATLPLPAQSPRNRVVATPDTSTSTQLAGHVPIWATAAHDAGAVPAGTQLHHLSILLARAPKTEAAFQQLLVDQQDPKSPRFHQWLTPVQTGLLYGVSEHDIEAVTAWLIAAGLTVDDIPASHVFITFSGDAAGVARALSTEFHNFTGLDSNHPALQYALIREPSVPSALAPVIRSFVGLSQQTHYPSLHRADVQGHAGAPKLTGAHPDVTFTDSSGKTYHWLLPGDFATIYDVTPAYNTGTTGTGERVAIIGGSQIAAADITNYEALAVLSTAQPTSIVVPGETDPGQTGNGRGGAGDETQTEATLDVTRVLGTATGSPVDLLLISTLQDTDVLKAINYNVSTLNDPVLSISFGRCEVAGDRTSATSFDTAFANGAAQGISAFVSSGDAEVAGCATTPGYVAGLTASTNILCTPNVTCVGGTQLSDTASPSTYWSPTNSSNTSSALSYIPEGAWNEPAQYNAQGILSYQLLGTGGAPSIFWPKPTWQAGTGVPADSARDTPDISLSASGHNSYLLCLAFAGADCVAQTNGSIYFDGVYGTSAAAPSMAGITAMLDQKLNARQGNLNPLLYRLSASSPNAFHDATPGTSGISSCAVTTASTCNNSTPGASGLTGGLAGFPLTTGYDLATGLGSVDVFNLLTAAAGSVVSTAPTSSVLTASSTTISASQSVNFTDTITSSAAGTQTGTLTGTVQFAIGGTNSGTPVTVASDAASTSISFPTAGTYTVTAIYSGDTNYATSTGTVTITVATPTLPVTTNTLTGTTGTISTQQTATYTATITSAATGIPAGTVQFYRTPAGSTVTTSLGSITVVSGVAMLPPLKLSTGNFSINAVYSGNSSFAASTSNALALTVAAVPTTTTLTPAVASIASTGSVTFSTTVVSSTSVGSPTGTVQFNVDGVLYGAAVPLSGLIATSPALTFTAGIHTVNAVYSGDAIFAASASGTAKVTSTAAPTAIVFNPAPPNTALISNTIPLTAVVSGLGTFPTTSAVVFKDGATVLGTVTPTYSGSTGSATFTAGPFTAGTHTLSATFTGDSNYTTSSTPAVSLVVSPPTTSTFTITPSPAAFTLASGATTGNTSTLTYTSMNGFAGLVTPTCAITFSGSGVPVNAPTCSFSPSTVTLASGSTATNVLAIGTTVPHVKNGIGIVSSIRPPVALGSAVSRIAGGITLSGLLVLLLPSSRRRALQNWRGLFVLCLLSGAIYTASGCGGGVSSGNGGGGTTTGPAATSIAFNPVLPASVTSLATVPLTAVVSGIGAAATASTIVFKDGTTVLNTAIPTYTGTTGTASYTAGPLSIGSHTLTASFTGDTNYLASTTPAAALTVTAPVGTTTGQYVITVTGTNSVVGQTNVTASTTLALTVQ